MELKKCIYGLRQASRRFFDKLQQILNEGGYKPTRADPCLYVKNTTNEFTMIAAVVDDLLIASDSDEGTRKVIETLRLAGLKAKDLGFPDYMIGMHIQRREDGTITLNQRLYAETLLRRFNMEDCTPAEIPARTNIVLSSKLEPKTEEEHRIMDDKSYRALVGALLYLVLTRPDIAVAVNECCRYLHNPGSTMWSAAKQILKCIKGTLDMMLVFNTNTDFKLEVYVDASYAECKDSRRSRGDHLI